MDSTLTQLLPPVQARVLERGIAIPAWRATDDERQRFAAAAIRRREAVQASSITLVLDISWRSDRRLGHQSCAAAIA